MKKLRSQDIRPGQMIMDANKDLPGIFNYITQVRSEFRRNTTWPEWCDTPDAIVTTTLMRHYNLLTIGLSSLARGTDENDYMVPEHLAFNYLHPTLTALYTWKRSKNVYRFDKSLSKELSEMEFDGALPVEVLYRLPEWCVYVDFEESPVPEAVVGFFAFLEYDLTLKTEELYIAAVLRQGYLCLPLRIFLGDFTLMESQIRVIMEDEGLTREEAKERLEKRGDYMRELLIPLLNHLIYLCSKKPDIVSRGQRAYQNPRKREYNDTQVVLEWDVGVRIGKALRAYKSSGGGSGSEERTGVGEGGTRRRPRAHIRRAHWHHYWIGSRKNKEDRELVVKWLHPIYINAEDTESMPIVVRTVD